MEGTYEGVVTTDGTRGRSQGVGGTEQSAAGLDGILALPDHSADGTAEHVWSCVSIISSVKWGGATHKRLDLRRRAWKRDLRSASRGAPWRGR